MKANEMTWFQTAIYKAIKEHCAKPENDYIAAYKPIEFMSMAEDINRPTVTCYDGTILTHYSACTRFKTENKYDDNIAVWDVCIYSNGNCGIYFDGTMQG